MVILAIGLTLLFFAATWLAIVGWPVNVGAWFVGLFVVLIVWVAVILTAAHARDLDGRYANSPLKPWFDSLHSGKGPCCSESDGETVLDADWESRDGHYRVRLPIAGTNDSEWVDVPDEAIITEPNKVGRTMVWPMRGYLGTSVRCFMPGSMT
jgi:hypothetical protein